jgi:5'-AMP-activated protein kinase catalytic alpha subunit
MVTGTFPFYATESSQLLHNILSANVTYPNYLSNSIIDLFKNIFIVDPRKRFGIDKIKSHPWFMK